MPTKLLMVSTVASTLSAFLLPHVKCMQQQGWIVDGAANGIIGNDKCISTFNSVYDIKWSRNPFDVFRMIKAMDRIRSIVEDGGYDVVHVHTPIASAVTRFALRHMVKAKQIKMMYTAHGFHFYKGAPLLNWLVYYPIEKYLSRYTDVLVTINKEDYARAQRKFCTPVVYYIPGIGVDIEKFKRCKVSKHDKRVELGIPDNAFVLLSVGELANRKNQRVVIRALGKINDPTIFYVIAGKGPLENEYMRLAMQNGIADNVMLLGHRLDIDEICKVADVFVHPSVREGLGIAPLESMAVGLPLISSYVNGIKDYTQDGVTGCCISNPLDVEAMVAAILTMRDNIEFRKRCALNNIEIAKSFDMKFSLKAMSNIYCRQVAK